MDRARTKAVTAEALLAGLILVTLTWAIAHAQVPPPVPSPLDPTGRAGEPPPLQREEPRPTPPVPPILPPLQPPRTDEFQLAPRERLFLREIRVVGATVVTDEELARVTAPYVNREVTSEDLEALRLALTHIYVNKGYVNSGAILPDQTVTDGVITYQIIEGKLTRIDVDGNRWFRSGYIRRRVALGAGPPLNVNELQQQLQLLLEDSRIRRLNADLRPDLRLGESILGVTVEERPPYRLSLDFNNYQSPDVGAERGIVSVEHVNLTGNGDILTLRYGKSEGLDPLLDFRYTVPFTARDTTLTLQYRKNTFTIVEEPFKDLEIESESEVYTIGLRQPIYRTLNHDAALELAGERLSNRTFLLGKSFTLVPGARNGESIVTAIRFAQEWIYRTESQVVAARSRFSFGVDALGSTIHAEADIPDSKFFAWLGQFQWIRRLPVLDTTVLFRADVQLTDDPLLSLEQVPVGGRYSVRGYRETTLIKDNAILASIEARVPIVRRVPWADYLELAPFADFGRGWNTNSRPDEIRSLSSVGIGLRWAVTVPWLFSVRPQLEFYWGHPLREIKTSGGDLQDHGLHFQLVVSVF
jgi:hemolysin activation/secretion protein